MNLLNPHRFVCISSIVTLLQASPFTRVRAQEDEPSIEAGRSERQQRRAETCAADPRVLLGQVTHSACVGADLFFRETFGGNGRTCSSCHPAENNYTLDRAHILSLQDDDPLFVAEYDPALAQLEISSLLRDEALFVVNADGFEADKQFVVRSAQHLLGLAVTRQLPPPIPGSATHAIDGSLLRIKERLGWSGDGAPGDGTLRDFADGAITQHATRSLARVEGVDFFLPNEEEKDALAEFTGSIGRTNELDLEQVRVHDPGAAAGLDKFRTSECALRCHRNAGSIAMLVDSIDPEVAQIIGFGNVTDDIGTSLARLPSVDALGVPLDGGHGTGPRDLDRDGVMDSFGNRGMNLPSIIEAADTGPMFHSNALHTVEEAARFYTTETFAQSLAAGIPFLDREAGTPMVLSEQEIADMGRFLRVLNTSLNIQMAGARLTAALQIAEHFGDEHRTTEVGLWKLAQRELEDAVQVLSEVDGLHEYEQWRLRIAIWRIEKTVSDCNPSRWRRRQLRHLRDTLDEVDAALGVGMTMTMGQGTLLF